MISLRPNILFLLGALAVFPGRALGQSTSDETAKSEAEKRFAEGMDLHKKHRFAEARTKFGEACVAFHTPSCPKHLGLAEYELGLYAEATTHLAEYLKNPAKEDAPLLSGLQKLLDTSFARSGHFDIAAPDGADVFVNEQPKGKAPLAELAHVRPGSYEVRAVLKDGRSATASATALAGKTVRVELEIAGITTTTAGGPPVPPTAGDPPNEARSAAPTAQPDTVVQMRTWPPPLHTVILGGVAVAALGSGIGFALDAANKNDTIARAPSGVCANAGATACRDLQDLSDARARSHTMATTFFAGSGLAAAAAVATWVLWPNKRTTVVPRVSPTISSSSAGISFFGIF